MSVTGHPDHGVAYRHTPDTALGPALLAALALSLTVTAVIGLIVSLVSDDNPPEAETPTTIAPAATPTVQPAATPAPSPTAVEGPPVVIVSGDSRFLGPSELVDAMSTMSPEDVEARMAEIFADAAIYGQQP